jgi:hypothetical protein
LIQCRAWTQLPLVEFERRVLRMLNDGGRRWTRKVRAGVKPLSRDRARVAFKHLKAIAKVDHVEGRGWYGLRRIAADLAESATTDDRRPRQGPPRRMAGLRDAEADLPGSADGRAPRGGGEGAS